MVLLASLSLFVSQGVGQEQPATQPASTAEAPTDTGDKGTLAPAYVDGSFGFSFQPPTGAVIDRRKRTVEGWLQLCQFVRLDYEWSASMRWWEPSRPLDAEGMAVEITRRLAPQFENLNILRMEPATIAVRPGLRYMAAFTSGGQEWLRQEAVICARPTEYFVLILVTPRADEAIAVATFEKMVASFQILRTEVQQQQLTAALDEGTRLLQSVASGEKKIAPQEARVSFLRLAQEGRDLGFVETHERAAVVDGKAGIEVLQRAWLFNADESVQFAEDNKFLSSDLQQEQWRTLSQALLTVPGSTTPQLDVSLETGIRRDDRLLVEYWPQLGLSKRQEKAIQVEPSFAPALWSLLFPRVVDLKEPALYGFSSYDASRRGLVLQACRVIGPARTEVAGRSMAGFKIEESEGLVPPVSEVYVDEKGNVLRVDSTSMEMETTTQAALEASYGDRVKQARTGFAAALESAPPEVRRLLAPPPPEVRQDVPRKDKR